MTSPHTTAGQATLRSSVRGALAARPAARGAAAARPATSGAGAALGERRGWRVTYLLCLAWAFTFFSAVRVLTYLPTLWAIGHSGASDQHSLFTWLTWCGANATMGLWLYEQADRRLERAALVNLGNAAMCFITAVVIIWHR